MIKGQEIIIIKLISRGYFLFRDFTDNHRDSENLN
jgi:hypothetical protein